MIKRRLYSKHCYPENGVLKKDLHQVNDELTSTLIVDKDKFTINQKDHVVHISQYKPRCADNELFKLASNIRTYMEELKLDR